ncbi:MAG: rod shape-determining protein MreD [Candidatus Viridilinea halotolerans]|uniref:Rod shape-determining protein MreD n=1 Tax=Candidatus Viridilinea halotolerans TaxID=2491704 RepID=A0A426TWW5_9CHLR|nr:MAG: rod shape-determining protein MreD [Candidatus Viridilinea halotolerans]
MGDSQPRRLEEWLARELGRVLALVALALVQATLLHIPLGFSLPLLLVLVVSRVLVGLATPFPDREVGYALRWAIYGGLTLDLLATTPLGVHALALLLAILVVITTTRRLRIQGILIPILAILLAALAYEGSVALLSHPAPLEWASYSRFVILPALLMALILMLPVYVTMRWFFEAWYSGREG